MSAGIAVIAQPSCLDACLGRVEMTAAPGTSIAQMIDAALPQAAGALRGRLRVLVGEHVILPGLWHVVRPKPGARVLIRAVPGNDTLRNVLTIAVTVGALALGQIYAPALAGSLGFTSAAATSLTSAAITATTLLAGTLLINALVPPRTEKKDKPTYAIQGLQNQLTPDGAVPLILGRVRYAPPYAARPYTTSVGDERYCIAAFCIGYGPVAIRNGRIGDTPIERYKDVVLEVRAGYAADPRLDLYPQQVAEEALSVELQTAAQPTGGPVIRTTAADVTACEIDVTYPGGVYGVNKDGEKVPLTHVIGTRFRLAGTGEEGWQTGPGIVVVSKRPKALTRTTLIAFPARGRYEIELNRQSPDFDELDRSKEKVQYTGRAVWSAIRSFRPEYPINFDKPLALAACKIRATGQLNGVIDALNFDLASICPDWDAAAGAWVVRETNNPASLFRYVLTGPAITYPLTEGEIAALGDWHAFCAAKGLTYNRVHDYEASVLDVLADIAAAGRASPHHTGTTWGVVIDRALSVVAAHISPRNAWGFSGERAYVTFPEAFRVAFLDETNGGRKAERVVPWPGFTGSPKVVEKLDLPGVTDPAMVWRETRRRQYELIHRRDTYTVSQDWESMVTQRGDLVQLSHDVLERMQVGARVKAVQADPPAVVLDEDVTFAPGQAYACRFRRDDGSSLLRSVEGSGTTRTLRLTGAGDLPAVGDLGLFGPATRESFACIVKGVEAMENLTARLTLVDHAPQIEALVDAEVPPPWSGRVGDAAQETVGAPLAPLITDVVSGRQAAGLATTDMPYPVVVLVQAAGGETQPIATIQAQYRAFGATAWAGLASGSGTGGAVRFGGYAKGDRIEIQARLVASNGAAGPWTGTWVHDVAATDPPAPAPPSDLALTTPMAGRIRVAATASGSAQTAGTRIYLAAGAGSTFADALLRATVNSGPSVSFVQDLTGLAAGTTYRVWVAAIDAEDPPTQSAPTGPVNATVV